MKRLIYFFFAAAKNNDIMKRLIYFFFAAAMMLSVAGCNDDPDFIKNAPPSSGETDGTDDDSDAGDDGTVEGVDPNFQIYLCFGQSNMEGFAQGDYNGIEDIDKTVDERFQVMNVVSGSWNGVQREVGHWYTAVPPLCRSNTGLCPADYFGRTMVEELSKTNPDIKVGVIVVAIGGAMNIIPELMIGKDLLWIFMIDILMEHL